MSSRVHFICESSPTPSHSCAELLTCMQYTCMAAILVHDIPSSHQPAWLCMECASQDSSISGQKDSLYR